MVIGIISALIGILLPVLSGARKTASDIKCQNNLRQLATAHLMYTQSSNGWLPLNQRDYGYGALPQNRHTQMRYPWTVQILPYLNRNRKVYICPVDPYAQQSPPADIADDWNYFEQQQGWTCSYLCKFDLGSTTWSPHDGTGYSVCKKITQVPHSAETILFDDAYF